MTGARVGLGWRGSSLAPGCRSMAAVEDEGGGRNEVAGAEDGGGAQGGQDAGREIRAADKRASGKEMTAILGSFHTRVSEPFGIGRGDRGNRRRHRKVDHRKALDLEVEGAELQARVSAEREAMAKASADAAELAAREEEARAAKALKDWAQGERESKRLQRENEDLAKKNEEGAATLAQVIEDIEVAKPGSAAGRAQREELEESRAVLARVHGTEARDRAREREVLALKSQLAVPGHRLGEALGEDEARQLVRVQLTGAQERGYATGFKAGMARMLELLEEFVAAVPAARPFLEAFSGWREARARAVRAGPER